MLGEEVNDHQYAEQLLAIEKKWKWKSPKTQLFNLTTKWKFSNEQLQTF